MALPNPKTLCCHLGCALWHLLVPLYTENVPQAPLEPPGRGGGSGDPLPEQEGGEGRSCSPDGANEMRDFLNYGITPVIPVCRGLGSAGCGMSLPPAHVMMSEELLSWGAEQLPACPRTRHPNR